MADDISTLRRILRTSRTIAVVGLSAEWHRPSNFAANYMQQHGYRVIPVNPRYETVLGERCHASLDSINVPIDIVDVFRKTEDVLPIARQAIAIGAKCLWQQIGVRNEEGRAARRRCRARCRDGSLREDRACAPVRRFALGRRQHRRDLGTPARLTSDLHG